MCVILYKHFIVKNSWDGVQATLAVTSGLRAPPLPKETF